MWYEQSSCFSSQIIRGIDMLCISSQASHFDYKYTSHINTVYGHITVELKWQLQCSYHMLVPGNRVTYNNCTFYQLIMLQ